MDFLIGFWNSLTIEMRCVLFFMVWLIVMLSLSNSASKAGRRGGRY